MPDIEELRKRLDRAVEIENTLDRRLWVLGVVSEALVERGLVPVLVGEAALELYLHGACATSCAEFALPYLPWVSEVLCDLGFSHEGHFWLREDLDVLVGLPFTRAAVDMDHVVQLHVDDACVHVLGIEDLIADTLYAAVHLESGKIEILGPRHWRWRIDFR